MAPREMVEQAALDPKKPLPTVLSQRDQTCPDPTDVVGRGADGATPTVGPARRPTVISRVHGTEYRAASSSSLRLRVDPPARETDAPRRGRRGR